MRATLGRVRQILRLAAVREREPKKGEQGVVKDFDPEDPEELVGVAIPGGDADQQLDCIVQEYLLMGWGFQQIMVLFRSWSTRTMPSSFRLYMAWRGQAARQAA